MATKAFDLSKFRKTLTKSIDGLGSALLVVGMGITGAGGRAERGVRVRKLGFSQRMRIHWRERKIVSLRTAAAMTAEARAAGRDLFCEDTSVCVTLHGRVSGV